MKKTIFATLACLCMTVSAADGQNARELYNRGLESSLAYKRIEYFTKALQLDPNLAEAYEKRAVHYYFQKRLDEAIQDYTRVIELKPEEANGHLMRGLAYLKKGHGQGFFAELDRLIHRFQKVWSSQSGAYLERAIVDFSRAIELDARLANAYRYRAEAYRVMGMLDQAIRDATTAIKLRRDPQSTAGAYFTRAEIYHRLGKGELYKADFLKAIAIDPYSSDYPPLHVPLMLNYSIDNTSLKVLQRLGLIGIIVLLFVVVFKLTLRAPRK